MVQTPKGRPNPIAAAFRGAIWVYRRLISPAFPVCCRFYPSCSTYATQAIKRHGAWRGSLLGAARLMRCQPFSAGGYDPVPESLPRMGEGLRRNV